MKFGGGGDAHPMRVVSRWVFISETPVTLVLQYLVLVLVLILVLVLVLTSTNKRLLRVS